MINLKRYIIFLLVLCSAIGYAQSFSSPTTIPANGTITVNGVTITTVSTGDVNNGTSANPQTPCLPKLSSPVLTTVPGQLRVGSSSGTPSASTAWSVTLNFSSPVNNVVFSITTVDLAENFIFNSNGGPVSLSHNSCYMNVAGNQAVTNGVSGGSVSDVTGGFFQANSPFPYTQLTINGNGGGFGSVILLSGGSIQPLAQPCTKTANIPPNGTFTVNGVTVNSASTGAVMDYWGTYSVCGLSSLITMDQYPLWVGSGSTTANSRPWQTTLTFSKPVNNIVVLLSSTGSVHNEIFRFTSNNGTISIADNGSCFSTISGNTIISGQGSSSTNTGGGGVFTLSSPTPFTQLVMSGDGGDNGSMIAICEASIKESCIGTVDSDGDGKPDECDLDDDNDGILDTIECSATSSQLVAYTNNSNYNASPYTTALSASNSTAGSGLTRTLTGYNYQELSGIDALNETQAITNNEYVEYSVTPNKYIAINRVGYYSTNSASTGENTQYHYSLRISADNFSTNSVLHGDKAYDPDLGDLIYPIDKNIYYLEPGKTYKFRVYFYAVNGGASATIAHDDFKLFGFVECDTDNDGTPNRLDLDSDGEGCADAIEGAGNFTASQLTSASGTLTSQTPNQNFGTTVDANGVPTAVGASGQALGQSQDASKNDCLDSDNDGVPNWQDLDDDNDGILDTDEGFCLSTPLLIASKTFSATGSGAAGRPNITFSAPTTGTGKRLMFLTLTIERDHTPTPYGDNWESTLPATDNFANAPVVKFGSNNMFPSSYNTSLKSSPSINHSDATISVTQYVYTLWDSQISPGLNSIDLSNFQLPKNAGDEWHAEVLVFDHVNNYEYIRVQASSLATNSLSISANMLASSQPAGTIEQNNVLLAFGATSAQSGMSINSGWNAITTNSVANTNGTYATDPNKSSDVLPENDGISVFTATKTGVTGNQTATFSFNKSMATAIMYRLIPFSCNLRDTDGDGIPDYLDLDSDADGCPDAKEGAGNFNPTTTASGTLSTQTPNINFGTTVDANGVPTVVGASGQAIGQSIDASKNDCLDTDGDGYPDWQDLDDDNDGILDTDECASSNRITNGVFPTSGSSIPGWTATGSFALNSRGLQFDNDNTTTTVNQTVSGVFNVSKINLNNVRWLTTNNAAATGRLITEILYNGTVYATINTGVGVAGSIPTVTGNNGASTNISTLPTVSSTGTFSTPSNIVITLPFSIPSSGVFQIRFTPGSTNSDDLSIESAQLISCSDFDGDGIPNQLDLDSDGDGCSDAREGAGNFNPTATASGTLSTQTPNINFGTTVDANGVPTEVGASGQALGQSIDASKNDCLDTDGDGYPDWQDLDDDNDGILDCVENGLNTTIDKIFKANNNATHIASPSNGPAHQYILTNGGSQNGQIWSNGKIDFTKSFSLPMKALLSGADGIAIVFHNSPLAQSASGTNGQGLGARGIANGIALELDTFQNGCNNDANNGENCDPNFDHGSIRTTAGWINAGKLAGDTQLGDGTVDDGSWHNVVINWNASTRNLSYTFDGVAVTNYTFPTTGANAIETILGGNSAYFGFTASTGLAGNNNSVGFDDLCALPLTLDSDNDGISNHLDLDSDGDGCSDAIEGAGNFTASQLTSASGTLTSQTPNQNFGTTVDANGVPTVVGASGQAIGQSIDATKNDCLDSDGDGYPNWQDLDDDNDGILDTNECVLTNLVTNGNFDTNFIPEWTNDGGWTYNVTGKYVENTASLGGSFGNFTQLISNLPPTTIPLTFTLGAKDGGGSGTGLLEVFLGGTLYATVNNSTATTNNITLTLSNGATSNFTPFTATSTTTYTNQTFTINIPYTGPKSAALNFKMGANQTDDWSLDNISINTCDTDADGIPNNLDLDSDNDGCPDAIEGGGNFTASQLTTASGTIAAQTPNQNFGIVVDANGVPTIVGAAGQTVGQSLDATKNDCLDSDNDGYPNWSDLDDDNDGILDTDECPNVPIISNGTFTSPVTEWTLGTGWDVSTGIARNQDDSVNSNLSQTLNNLNQTNGTVKLSFTLGAQDGFNNAGQTASLSIILNGTTYATFNNGTARAIGTNNVTQTLFSGATSTFTPFSTAISPGFTTQNITITIPYTGPDSATLTFNHSSGFDDWSIDNVLIDTSECDLDGDGIPNQLDLDSDDDGCPDALEGAGNFTASQLTNASGAIASQTPNQNFGTTVDLNGVPTIVNGGQSLGDSQNGTISPCCSNPPNLSPATDFTKTGISNLAGFANGWPGNVPNGFLAIESKNKGFVITRVANTSAIVTPVEGMLIYDLSANCVKLYNGTSWKCLEKDCTGN